MHRLSITFPDELIEPIKELAKENGRSFGKEVVQMVKAQLALEAKSALPETERQVERS